MKRNILKIILCLYIIVTSFLIINTNIVSTNSLPKTKDISSDYEPDEFYIVPNIFFSYIEFHIIYYKSHPLYYIKSMKLTLIIDNNYEITIKVFTVNDVPGNQLKLYNYSGIYSIFGLFSISRIKLKLYITTMSFNYLEYFTTEICMLNGLFFNIFYFIVISLIIIYYSVIKFELKKRRKRNLIKIK